RRPRLDPLPIELVRDAEPDDVDAGQDVELVEHDAAHRVDGDGIPQRHRIEPADSTRPAGDGPELLAALRDPGTDLVMELGGKRSGPDTGGIGLDDADDLVHLERADPTARTGPTGHRVGRGDVRVAAVIEVEERALRALEEHVLATPEGGLDEPG